MRGPVGTPAHAPPGTVSARKAETLAMCGTLGRQPFIVGFLGPPGRSHACLYQRAVALNHHKSASAFRADRLAES